MESRTSLHEHTVHSEKLFNKTHSLISSHSNHVTCMNATEVGGEETWLWAAGLSDENEIVHYSWEAQPGFICACSIWPKGSAFPALWFRLRAPTSGRSSSSRKCIQNSLFHFLLTCLTWEQCALINTRPWPSSCERASVSYTGYHSSAVPVQRRQFSISQVPLI